MSKLTGLDRIPKIKPKKTFDGELRAYQLDGLRWLHFLGSCGLNGILADEMGLGKTIQTLALLQYIKRARSKPQPSLVIAPTSILTNWYYEARKFVPNLKVLVLQGPQRKQHFKSIPEYDLVLSSYALLRIDRKELELHKFKYVILDEAQNLSLIHI